MCEERFDRDKEEAVSVGGRRYAHAKCAEGYEPPKEEQDIAHLHQYLQKLFKNEYNYVALNQQIESYVKDRKFSYSGILKTLVYWYEIKEHTLDKSNYRIGIVPFIYQDAYAYYLAVYMANKANSEKNLKDYINPKVTEIRIKAPTPDTPIHRLFNLDE